MKAFFTKEMSGIPLPKKLKSGANSTALETHRVQVEEYITIIMMIGKMNEQNSIQEWFELSKVAEHLPSSTEIIFYSGRQKMDEIEANTNKQLHNIVAQQIVTVNTISDKLNALEEKIKRKSTQNLLDEKEKLLEVADKEEILLAALKFNLNVWEGFINANDLLPIGSDVIAAEFNVIGNQSPNTERKKQKTPKKSFRKQISLKVSRNSVNSTPETKIEEPEQIEPSPSSEIREEAQQVLTFAQRLREQKSYITFKSQLEKMQNES